MIEAKVTHVVATYGEWFDKVEVDGKVLDPKPSQALLNHSPDGFAWGYNGSGPAQLALAILLQATGSEQTALRYYHHFRDDILARMPQRDGWVLDIDIYAWIDSRGLMHV